MNDISIRELLSDQVSDIYKLDKPIQANILELQKRLNVIRKEYGKPMRVTSGFRTLHHHLEIYAAKGILDKSKIPMQSRHLFGYAADISDINKDLQKWCLNNVPLLEKVGLWCEDFSATRSWIHFQIVPPPSGKRFFKP